MAKPNDFCDVRRQVLAGLSVLVTGLFIKPALADAQVRQAAQNLMGTRVDITLQTSSPSLAADAMSAAFTAMTRLSNVMSRYRQDSIVNALHLAAGKQPITIDSELMNVLKMAQHTSRRTQGAFDVTIGALTSWDFSSNNINIPDVAEIARERALVDYRDLLLDEQRRTAFLRRPGMRVDLGGIAKLPILQAGMMVLKQRGIDNAMINGGGDVLVSGQLQGRDWRIGVRDPRQPNRLAGVIALHEGFVASSGDYERFFMHHDRRYHHILDPQTGQPTQGVHGVALVSTRLEAINGLGAAVMVKGVQAGRALLQPLVDVDWLIADAGQKLWTSAGMNQRFTA